LVRGEKKKKWVDRREKENLTHAKRVTGDVTLERGKGGGGPPRRRERDKPGVWGRDFCWVIC